MKPQASTLLLTCALLLPSLLLSSLTLVSCSKVADHASPIHQGWKQKQLLITYSCSAPPTEKNIARAASENFNMIPASEEALPFAAKHNLRVMLEHGLLTPDTAHSPEKLQQLDMLVDRVKNNPALEAYYIVDEPQAEQFADIATVVARIRARDSKHLLFVNMLPVFGVPGKKEQDPSITYTKFLNQYIETVKPDLLSYDYYPFFRGKDGKSYDGPVYFVNLALVRQAAQKAHIPFLNIIQASNFENDWRCPNTNEMRWQVYTTLAYGAKGISYFLYWGPKSYRGMYQDGQPTELVEPVAKLNKEMAALAPELMPLNSIAVFQTPPLASGAIPVPADSPVQITSPGEFVVGFFGKGKTADTFMIVNRDYKKSAIAKLSIKNKKLIREFNRDTSAWQDCAANGDDTFVIDLLPGDGRLFRYE